MLDKYTFGNTPAALYLVELLNQRKDTKLIRKVSAKLTAARSMVRELEQSNRKGTLSVKHVASITHLLRENVRVELEIESANDQIILQLTANIITGELKSLARRAQRGRQMEHQQKQIQGKYTKAKEGALVTEDFYLLGKVITDKFVPNPVKVGSVRDDISPLTLQAKSRRKLLRKGKTNTLYPR